METVTACGSCLCNRCAKSFGNIHADHGEICYRCEEECWHWDHINLNRNPVKNCERYEIDNYHARKLREKWKVVEGSKEERT